MYLIALYSKQRTQTAHKMLAVEHHTSTNMERASQRKYIKWSLPTELLICYAVWAVPSKETLKCFKPFCDIAFYVWYETQNHKRKETTNGYQN